MRTAADRTSSSCGAGRAPHIAAHRPLPTQGYSTRFKQQRLTRACLLLPALSTRGGAEVPRGAAAGAQIPSGRPRSLLSFLSFSLATRAMAARQQLGNAGRVGEGGARNMAAARPLWAEGGFVSCGTSEGLISHIVAFSPFSFAQRVGEGRPGGVRQEPERVGSGPYRLGRNGYSAEGCGAARQVHVWPRATLRDCCSSHGASSSAVRHSDILPTCSLGYQWSLKQRMVAFPSPREWVFPRDGIAKDCNLPHPVQIQEIQLFLPPFCIWMMHLNTASRSECPLRVIKHWTCRWSHRGTSVGDAVCFLIEQRCFGPDRVPWDVRRTCENPSSCSPCWYVSAGVFSVWKRDLWAVRVEWRDWWMWF